MAPRKYSAPAAKAASPPHRISVEREGMAHISSFFEGGVRKNARVIMSPRRCHRFGYNTNFRELRKAEVRRIYLLRTWVNKTERRLDTGQSERPRVRRGLSPCHKVLHGLLLNQYAVIEDVVWVGGHYVFALAEHLVLEAELLISRDVDDVAARTSKHRVVAVSGDYFIDAVSTAQLVGATDTEDGVCVCSTADLI